MDVFKFHNPTSGKMEQGEIINGLKSKMWIERFDKEGEFTFTAPASSNMKDQLPLGSFVSHVESTEIMIVENHEINNNEDNESDITITGRGFETIFENRIIGSNQNFPVSGEIVQELPLIVEYTWNQIAQLIYDHINAGVLIDDDNALPYITVQSSVPGDYVSQAGSSSESRTVQRGSLYDRVIELLSIDRLGIKVIRPGTWSPLGAGNPNVAVIIHIGTDRSAEVIFSHDAGEIISADYLWSIKERKDSALVTGRWVETFVHFPEFTGYDRRSMFISASDIDQDLTEAPTGPELTAIVAQMQQRGLEAIVAQNDIALTKAELSKEALKAVYRTDFDVGDIITISGDYNEVSSRRISEYVEIEDETGESGYPTLSME